MNAETIVLTSSFVTLGSTVGGHLAQTGNLPQDRVIIGGFFAMLLCSILAEFGDGELGSALSVLIAGTAFVIYGLPAINSKTVTPTKTKAKK
jgi:hypothetical protein